MHRAVSVKGKQRFEYISAASGRYYQIKRRNPIRMGKRGEMMDERKIKRLTEFLLGLKQYEWSKISAAINMYFNSESDKLTLSDPERLRRILELHLNGKISH